ncbi:MAG: GNAT family N-acetyltransferase [Rickettsiales bacterium]|jgi:RimJ/RimL family protein N-acetyltransferase|nr:GNAT family N-acetyltransferase [Rickettsiales bacterium]
MGKRKRANEMTDFPEIIKDGDLELRRMPRTFESAKVFFDGMEKDRIKWVGIWLFENLNTPEDVLDWMKPFNEIGDDDTHWRLGRFYGIFSGGEYAGFAALTNVNSVAKKAELIYYLRQRFEGRGLMSRALSLIENELFGRFDWNKLVISLDDRNEKSKQLAARLGYRQEGLFRDHFVKEGRLVNQLYMARFRSDWAKENENA